MSDLLKRIFELFVKNRWLKTIDKETNKYNKLKSKLFRQQYVVNALLEEYKNIYNVDLRLSKDGRSDGFNKISIEGERNEKMRELQS